MPVAAQQIQQELPQFSNTTWLGDPDASAGLRLLLFQQWPTYFAFALAFTVVGTVWAKHRLAISL